MTKTLEDRIEILAGAIADNRYQGKPTRLLQLEKEYLEKEYLHTTGKRFSLPVYKVVQ